MSFLGVYTLKENIILIKVFLGVLKENIILIKVCLYIERKHYINKSPFLGVIHRKKTLY